MRHQSYISPHWGLDAAVQAMSFPKKHPRDVLYNAEDDPALYAPDHHATEEGGDLIFQAVAANDFLSCTICRGYLRDAHTFTECLHTFCKVCIYWHVHKVKALQCPKCGLTCSGTLESSLGEVLKFDRSMQRLVDKIFPPSEAEGAASPDGGKGAEAHPRAQPRNFNKVGAKRTRAAKETREEVAMVEVRLEPAADCPLPPLDRPRLRCAATVGCYTLLKYARFRLDTSEDLELVMGGRILGSEHSLEYLQRTSTSSDLAIQYRPARYRG